MCSFHTYLNSFSLVEMNSVQDLSGAKLSPRPPKPEKKLVFPEGHTCQRCKRIGHFSSSCKAKTDVKGTEIESDDGYDSRE